MDTPETTSSITAGEAQRETPPGTKPHLLERLVAGAHRAIDLLGDAAAPTAQRWGESLSSANEALHERADQARALGRRSLEGVRDTVRERPLTAVTTALLAGALIARLLQSRR
jgi:ElaB/YqjD/DUF883 family membrane-anchored ribosome-binding protein